MHNREDSAGQRIAQLTESRRVIVEAYEIERRRIERDLHDGAQQYLVAAAMLLGEARLCAGVAQDPALAGLLSQAHESITQGLGALRQTVRGIHPQVLLDEGLVAALEDVAAASASPIHLVCPHQLPALPEGVLAAGYFFCCEALANAHKHSPGVPVSVLLVADEALRISVVDEGRGGARIVPGHGLAGMRERLAAFGGAMSISSPPGGPTQVRAEIPLLLRPGEAGINP